MPITSTTEISGPVDVDFQLILLRNAQALCPYYMGTVPAEIAEHSGTFTAKWRRIENLAPTTTPLAELTGSVSFPTRVGVQPTVTDPTATVQKYGNFIYLSEEADLKNFNSQTAKLVEVLGINAGRSLNRVQRNVMEDNSTAVFGGAATTATGVAGAGITRSDITKAGNALNRQDALMFTPMTTGSQNTNTTPIRPAYWAFCHVDVEEDIRLLTGFTPVEQYAGQTETARGEFGIVGNVRFIASTEASIDETAGESITGTSTAAGRTTGSATQYDVYNTVVIGMDAVGSVGRGARHIKEIYKAGDTLPGVQMINHAKGSAGSADPMNELASLGWKSWHAGVILNSNWCRVIKHTASKLEA
jgi:N4-gp56 family major capsid protein